MAGIEVVSSYEWWDKANFTNQKNNRHFTTEIDIRKLQLNDLPSDIDIVVGSPPCTQFSYANRGGSGDIEDGLKDIHKFLSVVDFLRPKFWAMENVPRVASIFESELGIQGLLHQFAHLIPKICVLDTSEWGVPQRRQRCIIGNFDFDLLKAYRQSIKRRNLGDVINALRNEVVVDPIYRIEIDKSQIQDHVIEDFLSPEEERMNREMKVFHPVYNNMAFPDPLNRPARTVTATCTRVSRESIIIEAPEKPSRFRRLTVRERALLQGFPISYQFYGESYAQKLKMIGNAVPPLLTFYIAQAIKGTVPSRVVTPETGIISFQPPTETPKRTLPDVAGTAYPWTRRFRSAIPNLRFKSGVRFELGNKLTEDVASWEVRFFFGNSKNISGLELSTNLASSIISNRNLSVVQKDIKNILRVVERTIRSTTGNNLQKVWVHRAESGIHPYELVDLFGQAAGEILTLLSAKTDVTEALTDEILESVGNPQGSAKVLKNSAAVLAGILVGATANSAFAKSGS